MHRDRIYRERGSHRGAAGLSAAGKDARPPDANLDEFRHAALFYASEDEYLAGTVPFIREATGDGGAVLVAVSKPKIGLLQDALSGEVEGLTFIEMARIGRNPARIIPVWREFVEANVVAGRGFRGIGEPVWPERSAVELDECLRHEALLNRAFDDGPGWRLLCPYDAERLDDEVLADAHRSHPIVVEGRAERASETYDAGLAGRALEGELPPPASTPVEFPFDLHRLGELRRFVAERARAAGLDRSQTADLEFAANELANNSVRHGGGAGTARIWREPEALLFEVRDQGRMSDPLAGRGRPDAVQLSGRGLWLVNQLCDLVQVRSSADGAVARVCMLLP